MESGRDTIHLQIGERKGKGAAGREVSFSEKIAGDFAVERERAGEEKERDGLTVWSAVVRPSLPPPLPFLSRYHRNLCLQLFPPAPLARRRAASPHCPFPRRRRRAPLRRRTSNCVAMARGNWRTTVPADGSPLPTSAHKKGEVSPPSLAWRLLY